MRQLSKIFFINSANIPYAEIRIDGNTHFSGTQGVGKSTILRALLFFYNADPSRLGIRIQGQKKFDQFYLPHSNSYIVYEVERDDDRPFSVIVSRQNARAVYRFADGPFSKDWLIDENGIVTSDFLEVRRRVIKSGTEISNIVASYNDYRDIIFGNPHSKLQRSYDRYHLMRTSSSDNLTRMLTNVFLNDRIDADFIKSTIIRSMGEEEPAVRLRFFAEQLKNLSAIFHDTRLWIEPNRKGEIETLTKAREIIATGSEIIAQSTFIRELCGHLNYAYPEARRRLPGLKVELNDIHARLVKLGEKRDALASAREKEMNKVTMDLGVAEENIRIAEKARKKYEELGIAKMLRLNEDKPRYESNRQHLQAQILLLEQKAGDVAARFDRLVDDSKGRLLIFKRETQEKMAANLKQLNDELASLRKETDKELENLDENYRRKEDVVSRRKEAMAEEIHRLDLRIQETRHTPLYLRETEELQNRLTSLASEEKELILTEETLSHRLEAISNAIENDRLRIEEERRDDISEARKTTEMLKTVIDEENELLLKSKGSLIEWLDANVEGWIETIGRVANEKTVLYNTQLSPSLDAASASASSFFGVNIDLSGLTPNVRTPNEIRLNLDELNHKLQKKREILNELISDKDREIAKSKTRRMADFNEVKKEKEGVRGRLMTLPQRRNRATDDLNNLLRKAKEEMGKTLLKLEKEKEDLEKEQKAAQLEVESIRHKWKNDKKASEKRRREKEDSLRDNTGELNRHLKDTINAHERQTEEEILKLTASKTEALKKEGVDTEILQEWRTKLSATESMLAEIERNQSVIAVYRKEKEEYIDRIGDFKARRDSLRIKKTEMEEKYRGKTSKISREIDECHTVRDSLKTAIESLHEDIVTAEDFFKKPSCPAFLNEIPPLTTSEPCRNIIRDIRDYTDRVHTGIEKLKKHVVTFHDQFKQPVPFNFPTEFKTDSDYIRYAESVREFVENNKIQDFQTTSNGLYINVLGLISREYSTLAERETEIRKVVNEVNTDFARKSFAGVIRRIELRLDKSENPIITTLRNIHDFWSRHGLEIGEANLFSFEEKDRANLEAVEWLRRLSKILEDNKEIDEVRLTDNFSLKLNVEENDNSTGWIDNIRNIGSDGTDILVKAIINILLINVFKTRIGKKSGPFALHCMMDEIGKLAEENIKGIVEFANARGIYIANSSPKVHSPLSYRWIYMLTKDKRTNTTVHPILNIRQGVKDDSGPGYSDPL